MSDAVFPNNLPGIKFETERTPVFSTIQQEAVSGRKTVVSLWSSPRWRYSLSYEFLRDNATNDELKPLVGFFLARGGRADTFLFDYSEDNSITAQQIGVGNGTTAAFQLVRTYGGYNENIYEINTITGIYLDAVIVPTANYSVTMGLVTFGAGHIPTTGQVITATFTYYWRCRFMDDETTFKHFMYKLWELHKIEFETEKA